MKHLRVFNFAIRLTTTYPTFPTHQTFKNFYIDVQNLTLARNGAKFHVGKETAKKKKNSPSNARLTGAPLVHEIAQLQVKFQRSAHSSLFSCFLVRDAMHERKRQWNYRNYGERSRMVNTGDSGRKRPRGGQGESQRASTKFRKTLSCPQKPCQPAFCSPVIGPRLWGDRQIRSKFPTLLFPSFVSYYQFRIFPSFVSLGYIE